MTVIVYKTTNRVNGKVYVGIHEQADPSTFDGYLGSGKALKAAIAKYGKSAFQRETLEIGDIVHCQRVEANIVNQEFVDRKDTYNMTVGGNVPPKFSRPHTLEERIKQSAAQTGKTRIHTTNGHTLESRTQTSRRMKDNQLRLGSKHSEETRTKMSMFRKGRKLGPRRKVS